MDASRDITTGWYVIKSYIKPIGSHLRFNHVPTRIYLPLCIHSKNYTLFLIFIFVANYGDNIIPYFTDIASRFDWHDGSKKINKYIINIIGNSLLCKTNRYMNNRIILFFTNNFRLWLWLEIAYINIVWNASRFYWGICHRM